MLLTITATHTPATDLGYLLHKHPDKSQSFDLSFGQAHVFYPETAPERCSAALLLDIDPVGLVRRRRGPEGEGHSLRQYVNDRPYVASSFMSVAIAKVFSTALSGRCADRPELVKTPIPLEAKISVLPARGGERVIRELFEPLGFEVETEQLPLDEKFPEWGTSSYYSVALRATCLLKDLLSRLYVLMPVLDDDKHYWVSEDELEKLFRHGEGWLGDHPHRKTIVDRYLKRQRRLTRVALDRLAEADEGAEEIAEPSPDEEKKIEKPLSLNTQRTRAVIEALRAVEARDVIDLGCGEGRLLRLLLRTRPFKRITGMDVSHRALERAAKTLRLDRMPETRRKRLDLIHGSLIYRDERLEGYDAATVIEVIEHLDPNRLKAFERVLFECARPPCVVLTTPNIEYNAHFENLPEGRLRHPDHRFEWTRAEFQAWADAICERFNYSVEFRSVGPEDEKTGPPTQMGVFSRED